MRRNVSIVGLLQAAAVLTVIFSLLTALDLRSYLFELFSHFRLQYFVVSILLFLTFALLHRYAYAAALLLTVLLNGYFIVGWYMPVNSDAGGSEKLTLMHANVLASNDQYQRLIDLIASEDPDVIFLQEITDQWVAGLAPLQENYPFSYPQARMGNFGIAVYSKIPFDSVGHVDSPPLNHPTIVTTVTVGREKLTLISSHPTIPLGKSLYSARNQQLDSLLDLVPAADKPTVLLGDLNATVWDTQLRKLMKSAGLASARRGFGILPTWPTLMPFVMIPIDHVLVSESIAVTNMKTGKSVGSDHLPLIVTLSL
jgi:endonuclease/exonuclease/phosphatase (EEP) superfamily protein YafD